MFSPCRPKGAGDRTRAPGKAVSKWQPIETVPESGKVLALSGSGEVTIAFGRIVHLLLFAATEDKEPCFYTHWMPLPAPPVKDKHDD